MSLICLHNSLSILECIYNQDLKFRLEPIMLLKLLLSSAPKSNLLCSKLCSEIQIMLIGTHFKVVFNLILLIFADYVIC